VQAIVSIGISGVNSEKISRERRGRTASSSTALRPSTCAETGRKAPARDARVNTAVTMVNYWR
jgi:hypothetical protein